MTTEHKVPEVHIEPKIQQIQLRVFSEVPSSVEPFMLLSAVSFFLCGVLIFTCIVLSLRLQRLEAYQGIDAVGRVIKDSDWRHDHKRLNDNVNSAVDSINSRIDKLEGEIANDD
jgi:uncharacterized membrane protein YfhO